MGYIVAAVGIAIAMIAIAVAWRTQNRTSRRLLDVVEGLTARAAEPNDVDAARGSDRARQNAVIARLERSVQQVQEFDQQVQQAEVRLALALREVDEGIVVCDERGQIVFRNDTAQSFVGARHGEALVEAAVTELLRAALNGARSERELDLYGPPRRSLVVHAQPLRRDEMVIGAIAIIVNETDRRRTDAIRRDFVANVSHELKTPIGALALLAETLEGESDPAVMRRLAGHLRSESFRVSNMVDDLLALSRIEGNDSPNITEIGVDLLVRECIDRVHPSAQRRQVTLSTGTINSSVTLFGDRTQVASALSNLLQNAVNYSEPGASVEITVEAADDAVAIAVKDHGIGIPSGSLERIFERFYRVDKARSRETGGSGLGLSIARHVARNHGGDVTVTSREGEGSTFTLRLAREPLPMRQR